MSAERLRAQWPAVPAWEPADGSGDPVDHVRALSADDDHGAWYLDFHHPRGVVPLAIELVDDIGVASQEVARSLAGLVGGGFTSRLVGPHVYLGPLPEQPADDAAQDAARHDVDGYPDRFAGEWAEAGAALDREFRRLDAVPVESLDRAGLEAQLAVARRHHQRAWQVHFEVMYRLFGVQRAWLELCLELGLDETGSAALLQGDDTAIHAADRALDGLVRRARGDGLAEALVGAADEREALEVLRAAPTAVGWLAELASVVSTHGLRSDAPSDLTAPSWREDPSIAVALVRGALAAGPVPPRLTRDAALEAARARLGPVGRQRLDDGLQRALRANAVWWSEEHNAVIDLRAHLPVRRVALAIGTHVGAARPDDVLMLVGAELDALLAGEVSWPDLHPLVRRRREWHDDGLRRREALPPRLGDGEPPSDLVLQEVLGVGLISPVRESESGELHGLGVSAGSAVGRVRVVRSADGLPDVAPGEVLVCEATSPSWTPVFERAAACVCDAGGMLTHAAIICREYGVPCVCAVGWATTALRTGDLVEVDGSTGTVRVLERAPGA